MAKFTAEQPDADAIEHYLRETRGLDHLRTRRRADVVVIESGPERARVPHARLRRVGVGLWCLEMATHTGRWEPTPIRAQRDELVRVLVEDFAWALSSCD